MMDLNKKYKIKVNTGKGISIYTCSIKETDDFFIKVEDREGKEFIFSKESIKSMEVLS